MTFEDGRVERLRPGVVVFFPAGSKALWEVDGYVRKLAVFREPAPLTLALVVRAWSRFRSGLGALRRPAVAG